MFCTFYELLDHQKAAVTIVVRPPNGGSLTNTATVSSFNFDPNPRNNQAKQHTTVTG